MAGIISYGGYIPIYRLSFEEIARVWGGRAGRGEKAVANADEDSITMAVEASTDCLNGIDRDSIDGLYFASTTPPYKEKQSASIVAAALDLRQDIFAADFTDSLRAGASAMRAAMDAVAAGSANRVLVVASDCRLPAPNSELEQVFGDGAAALLIGNSNVAVNMEGSYVTCSEFIDLWRTDTDTFVRAWEDRFTLQEGYANHLREAVSGLTKNHNLSPTDFAKAAFYAPNARSHTAMVRTLGLDAKQVQDPLFDRVGNTGAAFAFMMFVAALEDAEPGDRILLAGYGDGADAYLFRTTEAIGSIKDRRGVKHHLASKMSLPYGKYLRFRNLTEPAFTPEFRLRTSLPILWRDRKWVYRFRGHKCKQCGHVQYPMQQVCMWCQARGDFEEIRLSDRKGTLFTFSMDERAAVAELPNVIAVVEIGDEARFYSQMTDRDPGKVEIGMPMEITFRNMHTTFGIRNYFWKCRPIRV